MVQVAENTNLVRKQIMLSNDNLNKLANLAKQGNGSVASIVREAIDAYNPNAANDSGDDSELMALVASKLKEAIADTAETRKRLNQTLSNLESVK